MFGKRLVSSIVLVALALVFLLSGGYVLAAALLFLSVVAYRELMKACGLHSFPAPELFGDLGIIAYYVLMVFTSDRVWLLLTVFTILVVFMGLYVFAWPRYRAQEIMMSVFCVIYAPLMLAFIYLVRELPYGKYAVWMIFISSWVCDTCAYCVGKLIGKHKLAPHLSPKKSIEGAVGGILGSMLVGGLFAYFLMEPVISEQQVTWLFVLISAIGAVVSQIGDLAASAIKRNMDIKDYGHLIPGHGGVMDRFDSVIFTAPMIYFLTLLLIH